MNPSRIFILRPVGTTLLMVAMLLVGVVAYRFLPVSALPEVDYPTIQVTTFYPGASPEVMTTAVTAPLERQFGEMPGLTQMSSVSSAGAAVTTLQFDLNLSLDVAEQEVQAAINAATGLLPAGLPAPPVYAKINPANAPVLTLAATSKTLPLTEVEDVADVRIAQKLSQVSGRRTCVDRRRAAAGAEGPTEPARARRLWPRHRRHPHRHHQSEHRPAERQFRRPEPELNHQQQRPAPDRVRLSQPGRRLQKRRRRFVSRTWRPSISGPENTELAAWANRTPAIILNIQRQPGTNVIAVVDAIKAVLPKLQADASGRHRSCHPLRPDRHDSRLRHGCRARPRPRRRTRRRW